MIGQRLSLGVTPTPLEPLERLSAELGGGPRIWVKREDATGLAGGGNKVRKLEFLLADAVSEAADVVLTSGAVQSNHARLTAAACARVGLRCELWLNRRVPGRSADYERSGNILLDRLLGARVELMSGDVDAEAVTRERAQELRGAGVRPYVIPTGGSNVTGARGYVECARELLSQAADAGLRIDAIVVGVGSGGTLAGLAAGLGAAGWEGRLVGVSVSHPAPVAHAHVRGLAGETAAAVGSPESMLDFEVDDRFVGSGYGVPTSAGLDAIRLLARTEGLLLDPTYTGKAMAGLAALVAAGSLTGEQNVVFLHTGGWPALFAYLEDL